VVARSTKARVETPVLPDLGAEAALPRCVRTVVDGVVAFDGEA